MNAQHPPQTTIQLATGVELKGFLEGTQQARGLIVFVHGSGSSRFSVRNNQVAQFLRSNGFATLLMDLLTTSEDQTDAITRELRFNIPLLAERVTWTLDWLAEREDVGGLPNRPLWREHWRSGRPDCSSITADTRESHRLGRRQARSGGRNAISRAYSHAADSRRCRHTSPAIERNGHGPHSSANPARGHSGRHASVRGDRRT